MEKAQERGIGALFLEGDLAFYSYAGFVPAHTLKSADYGEPKAYEANEAAFPKKKKRRQEGQLLQFCQSCGMPLTEALLGTKPTGAGTTTIASIITKTAHSTMEGMAEFCAQFVGPYNEHTGRDLAREAYKTISSSASTGKTARMRRSSC